MRNYEGYAVYNKKTDKIVAKDVSTGLGLGWIAATVYKNKRKLNQCCILGKNEEIRKVRVIPESHFE